LYGLDPHDHDLHDLHDFHDHFDAPAVRLDVWSLRWELSGRYRLLVQQNQP
jgi:hypothetical protein